MFFSGGSGGGPAYPRSAQSMAITPIASSVLIKSLSDMQSQLAKAIDAQVEAYPAPGPKAKDVPADVVKAWCGFPRSLDWYGKLLTRLADIAASVDGEQAMAELVLQWLPSSIGASQPGAAFQRSQFDFVKFSQRLHCVQVASAFGGSNRKEFAAKQDEQNRNEHLVQIVVCIAVCDVLAALLAPRPERMGTPIDPDIGHTCVQLAFGQFNPASEVRTARSSPPTSRSSHPCYTLLALLACSPRSAPVHAARDPRGQGAPPRSGFALAPAHGGIVGGGGVAPRTLALRSDRQRVH